MSTFVDNDGLRIEVLFSGNGVRAVSSQWATQGRVLHNGSLSLFGIVGERNADGRIAWSNGASCPASGRTPLAHRGPWTPPTIARRQEYLDLEFGLQFGNKTLEREGCRDLEQCRTHWAARRASVVETLAREPPLSDRGVYA